MTPAALLALAEEIGEALLEAGPAEAEEVRAALEAAWHGTALPAIEGEIAELVRVAIRQGAKP